MALTPFFDINDGEDPFGYTLRRLQAARRYGLTRFMRRLGASEATDGITVLPPLLPKMAELLQIPEDRFRAAWFIPEERKVHAWTRGFGDQRLRSTAVVWPRVRICPACLAEKGFIPLVWQLTAYTDCPHHRIQMIHVCPGCQKRLTWARRRPMHCNCGFDLRESPPTPSDPNIIALVADIERRALGRPPMMFADAPEVHGLQGFLDLCVIIGRLVIGARTTGKLAACELEITRMRGLLAAAGGVLAQNWPSAMHAFFDRIMQPPTSGRVKLSRMFPGVYLKLYRLPELAPVRDSFEQYFSERYPHLVPRLGPKTFALKRLGHGLALVSMFAIARRLKISAKKLLEIASRLEIEVIAGPGHLRRISEADATRIEKELSENAVTWLRRKWSRRGLADPRAICGMDLSDIMDSRPFPDPAALNGFPIDGFLSNNLIAARWGTSVVTVARLVDAGFFNGFGSSSAESKGKARAPVSSYGEFEETVAHVVRPWPKDAKRRYVSFMLAFQNRIKRQSILLGQALGDLLDGALGPCVLSPDGTGLARLHIEHAAVEAYVERAREARLGDRLPMSEAMRMIHVTDPRVMAHLARAGRLDRDRLTRRGQRGRSAYSRQVLEAFRDKYVSLTEIIECRLLRALGRDPHSVRQKLGALGVKPVMGPEIDGCRALFFARPDIDRLMRENAHLTLPGRSRRRARRAKQAAQLRMPGVPKPTMSNADP